MADIYRPDYTRDNRFRTYLNQYSATSGTVPSASLLDRIVQSELDAAAKNFYRSKEIQRQKQRDAIERMDRERALESQKTQNLAGGITQLATTGLGLMGKEGLKSALATGKTLAGDAVNKATTTASGLLHHTTGGMFGTAPQATTAATETLPVVPAVAETATGLGSPVADAALQAAMDAGIGNVGSAGVADLGATLASQAPEVATAIGTGSGPILPGGGGMMPAMSELTATGVGGASTAASEAAAIQAAMDAGVGNAVGFDAGAELAAEGVADAAGSTVSEALPALGAAVKVGKGLYDVTQAQDAHEDVQGVWNMADGVLRYVLPYYGMGRTAANLVNAGLGLAGVDDKALKVMQSVFDPAGALAGEYGNIAAWLGIEDFLDDLI